MNKPVRIALVIVGVIFLFGCATSQSTLPLPKNVNIVPPKAAVPGDVASFSGAWHGTWSNGQEVMVVIEDINPPYVKAIYACGTQSGGYSRNFPPEYKRYIGIIEKKSIVLFDKGNELKISLADNANRVLARHSNLRFSGAMFRADEVYLERSDISSFSNSMTEAGKEDPLFEIKQETLSANNIASWEDVSLSFAKGSDERPSPHPDQISQYRGVWQGTWPSGQDVVIAVEDVSTTSANIFYHGSSFILNQYIASQRRDMEMRPAYESRQMAQVKDDKILFRLKSGERIRLYPAGTPDLIKAYSSEFQTPISLRKTDVSRLDRELASKINLRPDAGTAMAAAPAPRPPDQKQPAAAVVKSKPAAEIRLPEKEASAPAKKVESLPNPVPAQPSPAPARPGREETRLASAPGMKPKPAAIPAVPAKEEARPPVAKAEPPKPVEPAKAGVPPPNDSDPSAVKKRYEKALAIVIGIEQYRQRLPKADYAVNDARLMTDYLIKDLGIPEESVVTLINDRALKSDLEKYFDRWLSNNVEEDSLVFIYFSGHGAPNIRNGEAYLVPYDGDPTYIEETCYPLNRLYGALEKIKAREIFVALDSCFSGAGGKSVLAKGTKPLVINLNKTPRSAQNIVTFSASSADEVSSSYEDKNQGLFTYFLIRGLRGEADIKGTGFVSPEDLYKFIKPRVQRVARRQYNNSQTPQLTGETDFLNKKVFYIEKKSN